MKRLYLFCIGVALMGTLFAHAEDTANIRVGSWVADNNIPAEACRNLENTLLKTVTTNGMVAGGTERFILTAKVEIMQRDIAPTTPPRISQKLELTIIIGDIIEDKVYGSCTVDLSGIGTNETKAYISAFQQFRPQNAEVRQMLADFKKQAVSYYSDHCDAILKDARTLAGLGKTDEAIYRLTTIPDVCSDCYQKCQDYAVQLYTAQTNRNAASLLQQARAEWAANPNAEGATAVATLISQIPPEASNQADVKKLQKEVSAKLEADAKRDWDFQMKKYEDSQVFKRSIVDAAKAVGVAFGNGQPQSVVKNILHRW